MTSESRTDEEGGAPQAKPGAVAATQRIVVRDLIVLSSIGVSSEERAQPQRIQINLEVEIEPRIPRSDKIVEVANYGPMVGRVREICTQSRARLLETLAAEVAKSCFLDDKVRAVRVRIEKLDRYKDVGGIGVAIDYRRDGT